MATINRNKEIKTDTIALVNRATELYNRNERARAYSRSVSRKRKANERKENIFMVLAPIGILGFMYICFQLCMELSVVLGGIM